MKKPNLLPVKGIVKDPINDAYDNNDPNCSIMNEAFI